MRALALALIVPACSAAGQTLSVPWSTVDGGGGLVRAAGWSVHASVSQPDAIAELREGPWSVSGGFWPQGSRACPADFNGDGFLDFFDYDDYVNCFETAVCPPGRTADFNGDGFADFFDYDDFVAAFEVGC